MKQFFSILSVVFFLTLKVEGQTLESVTFTDNVTTNAIWVTGFGNYNKNVNAIGLYYHLNKGYLDVMNPSTAAFSPLILRGSTIELGEGNVGIGTTAASLYKLTVKGPIWSSARSGTVTSASAGNSFR